MVPTRLLQLSLFVTADILYETVRGVAESNAATAFNNARGIVELEQSTGLFFEQGLQTWAMGQRVLIDFANFMYVNSHFVITTSVLVWLYLRHNERFYFVRNMFMVAMGLALVGYILMPTAPPRFFPELGFVDTIAYYVNVKHDSGLVALFFNPYAAVPSMHVAFSLMISDPHDADRAQPVREGAVGALSARRHVRRARRPATTGSSTRWSARGRRHLGAGRAHVLSRALAGCMVMVRRATRSPRVARAFTTLPGDDGLNGRATAAGNAGQTSRSRAGPRTRLRQDRPRGRAPRCARTCASA